MIHLLNTAEHDKGPDSDFMVYRLGFITMSVCVKKNMDRKDVESNANKEKPAGTESGWEISDQEFASGDPNPCICNKYPGRIHYLLHC